MSIEKNNVSTVLIPGSRTRQEAKRLVMTSNLKGDHKYLLLWILDQAEGYVVTVGQIQKDLVWGRKKWISARDQLEKLQILRQLREGLPNKTNRWTLAFDLTPISDIPDAKGEDRVRA